MKLKKLCLVAAALLLVAGSSSAQQENDNKSGKYFDNEFSFDAFGGYTKTFNRFEHVFDRDWRHGNWGGGIGLNYFLLRYLGIGADTFWQDQGEFWSNVSGNIYLRLPIGNTGLAPYIYGGGGRRFDPATEWVYGAGVGLQYRFTRHVGLFIDDRYYWAEKTTDRNLVRAGMQFAF